MLTFVVARFKEDVSWLNDLPLDARIYLYNKGPAIEPGVLSRDVTLIELPNAGRESGSYIHHLMHNFDEVEGEFTVFTQADPFEHAPHILDLVRVWQRWDDVQPLSLMWLADKKIPPSRLLERERGDWIDDLAVRREFFSLTTWAPVGFFDEGAWGIGNTYRQKHMLPNGTNIMAHFMEFCGLKELAAAAEPAEVGSFSYGAIFAVRNRRITEFLQQARPHLDKIELLTRADLNYGYIFERCWLHLFGAPFVYLSQRGGQAAAGPEPAGVSANELRNKAFARMAEGCDDEAQALLKRALMMAPADAELMSDLAALALRRGDYAGGIAQARRALSTAPDNDAALFTLGVCQSASGDNGQAMRSLTQLTGGPRGRKFQAEQPELFELARQNLVALQRAGSSIPA
jgi:tetratricopeptide (TPR) repeat protein